eukprot:scaffold141836_cov31-Prasinocladus_malaysianus.AAC.1
MDAFGRVARLELPVSLKVKTVNHIVQLGQLAAVPHGSGVRSCLVQSSDSKGSATLAPCGQTAGHTIWTCSEKMVHQAKHAELQQNQKEYLAWQNAGQAKYRLRVADE